MAGFFEKLKKGMENDALKINNDDISNKKNETKNIGCFKEEIQKKEEICSPAGIKNADVENNNLKSNFNIKPISKMPAKEISFKKISDQEEEKEDWLESEGQLAVDVFQTENELVIQAPIAGIKVDDIDIIIEEEVVTIKGARKNPFAEKPTGYFIQECWWGPFSRKIILPLDADSARADASMKEGILTIRIPKIIREKKRKVSIRE